jgi:hypothetical protein
MKWIQPLAYTIRKSLKIAAMLNGHNKYDKWISKVFRSFIIEEYFMND